MKRIFILAIASVLATGIQGCSKIKVELAGFTKSTTIPATDFRGIEVHNGIEVEFTDECSEIYVETDANVLPYMEVYESGRVLHIKYADHMDIRGNRWTKLHTFVRIPYRADVRSVSLSGGSTFTSGLPIVSESVSVEASGGSRIYCDINADADASIDLSGGSVARCNTLTADMVYLDASGGSVLKACGETGRCDIDLSGGSRLEGERRQPYGFYIDRCYGDLSGGSTATFSSDGEIDCELSGGSHIYYIGDAIYHGSSFSGDSGIEWDGPSSI